MNDFKNKKIYLGEVEEVDTLKAILENNKEFQELLNKHLVDRELSYIHNDYFPHFSKKSVSEWHFKDNDNNVKNYIKVADNEIFIKELIELQENYNLLSSTDEKTLNDLNKKIEEQKTSEVKKGVDNKLIKNLSKYLSYKLLEVFESLISQAKTERNQLMHIRSHDFLKRYENAYIIENDKNYQLFYK